MENLKEAFFNLNLDLLPKEWVSETLNSNFSIETSLPEEFTSQVDLDVIYNNICELILEVKKWRKQRETVFPSSPPIQGEFSWQILMEWKIPKEALICLLSTFIKHNIKDINNVEIIIQAIDAARLYVLLLGIPGSYIFNIFYPELFDHCFQLLKIGKKLVTEDIASKKHPLLSEIIPDGEERDQEENLTAEDKQIILKRMCLYLYELAEALDVLKLSNEHIFINTICDSLVSVITLEKKLDVLTSSPPANTIGYAAMKAYEVLEKLCSEEHGNSHDNIRTILKAFTKVLYQKSDTLFSHIIHDDGIQRNHVFSFLLRIVEKYEKVATNMVIALTQQLLIRIPDRAETRTKMTSEIAAFVDKLPPQLIQDCIVWTVSLSFGEAVKHRVSALEIVSKFLEYDDKTLFKKMHELLIGSLISNSIDKSALIRYKSLNIFASNIFSNHPEVKKLMTQLFVNADDFDNNEQINEDDFFNFNAYFTECKEKKMFFIPTESYIPPGYRIIKLLDYLSLDEKVFVRKNALLALSNICLLEDRWINNQRLEIIEISCKDSSVMIRKQMAKCLTNLLLKYPSHKKVVETWVEGIITLIADNDVKFQEKVMEYIHDVVIGNITQADSAVTPESTLPWRILKIIATKEKQSLFKLACSIWTKQGAIQETTLTNIVSHTNSDDCYMAWFLIGCLSDFFDFPNPEFIYKYFIENIHMKYILDEALEIAVMEALFLNVKQLSEEIKKKLFPALKPIIECFQLPLHLIGLSLNTLALIDFSATKEWCGTLTKHSANHLLSTMKPNNDRIIISEFCHCIFTLGDAALFHPGVDSRAIACLVSIIDSPDLNGRLKSSFVDLRAVSVLSLAKICLQDHFLAKKHIPKLALLLNDESTSINVKINTLAALADLCIRFTSAVEDYIGYMCLALKDDHIDVRKCALEHIVDLISQDYLKLKSPLFYYLLTMLLDECPRIKECYESFIMNTILKRNPGIMSQFFIEAIFFFNDFEGKKGFGNKKISTREKILFGLAGVTNFRNRETIYKFMLTAMQDDHRLRVLNKILIDILELVIENKLELNKKGNAILKDALNAMALKEMRFEHLHKEDDDKPIEDRTSQDYVLGLARKVILSQILKKNYIESLVPVVAGLRRKLLHLRSPLARDLMITLREMMKDYKREVNEIFAVDPQLAAEVAFDLRNVEVEQTVMEELAHADPGVRHQVTFVSQVAMNETGLLDYRTVQEILDEAHEESSSVLSGVIDLPPSKSQKKSQKNEPLCSQAKSDYRKKELPIFQHSRETSTSLFAPSTSKSEDVSMFHRI